MTADRHSSRVPSKAVYVLLHPLQSHSLIEQTDIVDTAMVQSNIVMADRHEAKNAETVLDVDKDHFIVVGLHEDPGVCVRSAFSVFAAIYSDKHFESA